MQQWTTGTWNNVTFMIVYLCSAVDDSEVAQYRNCTARSTAVSFAWFHYEIIWPFIIVTSHKENMLFQYNCNVPGHDHPCILLCHHTYTQHKSYEWIVIPHNMIIHCSKMHCNITQQHNIHHINGLWRHRTWSRLYLIVTSHSEQMLIMYM